MINTIDSNSMGKVNTASPPVNDAPKDPTKEAPKKFEKKFSKEQKRKIPSKYLIAGIILLILTIGGGISLYLSQQEQDLRQQADQGDYTTVPSGGDCSWGSAARCQGGDPGDACGDGVCRSLPNQLGTDGKAKCTCDRPGPEPTDVPADPTDVPAEPTDVPAEPTDEPVEPTDVPAEPTDEPFNEPTDVPEDDGSSSSSYSESNSSVTVDITNENNTAVGGSTTQPDLPSELPESGPEDWLQYLRVGLGALGAGAILLLFL